MAPIPSPERLILALTDTELESFVREWVMQKKKDYVEVERFTGPDDKGRDVVGYVTSQRHEDNYQCKQYGRAVPLEVGLRELGKVLYHASKGEFSAPTAYFFVAPKGLASSLRSFISKSTELKRSLTANWDKYCAEKISDAGRIDLDDSLKAFIDKWDFAQVQHISIYRLLDDPAGNAVMIKWFGKDPGPAPIGQVPTNFESREMPYVRQLLDAYGERESCSFKEHNDVKGHSEFAPI
jgi:hypothetical protein